MPIQLLNVPQPAQLSLSDSMRKWGDVRDSQIKRDEALGDIGRQQKVRDYYAGLNGAQPNVSAVSAIDPKAGMGAAAMNHQQAQMGVEQAKATKQVMTHFWHGLTRAAKAKGIEKGTPQFQQLGNAYFNSTPMFAQVIKNATGNTYDPTKDIDLQAAESMADPTPEEQNQADIAQKVAEQAALQPGRLEIAQAQAGIQRQNQDYVSPMEQQRFQLQQQSSQRASDAAERSARAAETQAKTQGFGQANALRDEFNAAPPAKNYQLVATSYETLKKAWSGANPTAQDDMSGIFTYMKMLDPNSTVREGEYANAQNTTGVPDKILNLYNQAAKGERINPEQRKGFVDSAAKSYETAKAAMKNHTKRYTGLAQKFGVDPSVVVSDFSIESQPMQTFTSKPPVRPGFRIKKHPTQDIWAYVPEGG